LGESVIFLAKTLREQGKKCRVVAVDTFQGEPTDPQQAEIVAAHEGSVRAVFDANVAAAGVEIEVIEGDSAEAAKGFKDGEAFAVFIDADHSTYGVLRDLEAWRQKAGSIIAGHDIDAETVKLAVDTYFDQWQISGRCWVGTRQRKTPTLLSVLIPTITEREDEANALFRRVEDMARGLPVEVIALRDNRRCGIGEARNKLLRAAGGRYITFLDDDDDLSDDYFRQVLPYCCGAADVISYDQRAIVDGAEGRINCRLGHELEPFRPGAVTKRPPWFWCVWRRELACAYAVPQVRAQEDVLWLRHLWAEAETEAHIPQVLHRYNFSSATTTLQKPLTEAA
jgi:glycosyltransferase involved in cell wall biosynthesis